MSDDIRRFAATPTAVHADGYAQVLSTQEVVGTLAQAEKIEQDLLDILSIFGAESVSVELVDLGPSSREEAETLDIDFLPDYEDE